MLWLKYRKGMNMVRNTTVILWVLTISTMAFAGPPPVPQTPASVNDLLYAREFSLDKGYTHNWCLEKPFITSGYLVVLRVNPDLVFPRQTLEPVLYAGDQTAQRINSGYESGVVIAVIPEKVDLFKTPIWFGTPELPERVSADRIKNELMKAEKAGIRPFSEKKVTTALKKGGDPLQVSNMSALLRGEIARLILTYSPQEKQLADDFRVPVNR
jgi:hypothetical protein